MRISDWSSDVCSSDLALPQDTMWAPGGLGASQLPMNSISVFMGGNVRTGLEDNPALDPERHLDTTNAALVSRVAELAQLAQRPLATATEVRELLDLRSPRPLLSS